MIVATNTPPKSIPVPSVDKMAGLTTIIYAIVKNVAKPANNSVFTLVPFSFNLKIFSNIQFLRLVSV